MNFAATPPTPQDAIDAHVPLEQWGKDHWSTLAYVEVRIVEHDGWIDQRHMRGRDERYPTRARHMAPSAAQALRTAGQPVELTRLIAGHGDWDCVADFYAEALVDVAGDVPDKTLGGRVLARLNAERRARLTFTSRGAVIAGALRAHKIAGGTFASFELPSAAELDALVERGLPACDSSLPTRAQMNALELIDADPPRWRELRTDHLDRMVARGWLAPRENDRVRSGPFELTALGRQLKDAGDIFV